MGKPEDKYSFFCKATELERIDRHYAVTKDAIIDLEASGKNAVKALRPAQELERKLAAEWEECRKLESLEDKVEDSKVNLAWCMFNNISDKVDEEKRKMEERKKKLESQEKKIEDLEEKQNGEGGADLLQQKEAVVTRLAEESKEAALNKKALQDELRDQKRPLRSLEEKKGRLNKDLKSKEGDLKVAKKALHDARKAVEAKEGEKGGKAARAQTLATKQDELDKLKPELDEVNVLREAKHEEFQDCSEGIGNADDVTKLAGRRVRSMRDDIQALQVRRDRVCNIVQHVYLTFFAGIVF